MFDAAEKMKSVGMRAADDHAPSSIFGSASHLADTIESGTVFRIAAYPILSATMPDVTMGIASCLCYLLEQQQEIKVYRCFARIEPDDENSEITTDDYQFNVDDWELDGLDDNVTLAGRLYEDAAGYKLELMLDSRMLDDATEIQRTYNAKCFSELLDRLPEIAADLIADLIGEPLQPMLLAYGDLGDETLDLSALLEEVFGWNLDLYLYHWGVAWPEEEIKAQFLATAELCQETESSFAFWCLGMMAQQVMQLGLEELGEVVAQLVEHTFVADIARANGAAAVAVGLSRLGYLDRATDLLESIVTVHPETSIWYCFVRMLSDAGHIVDAIDACQRALEGETEHSGLYWRYVELLILSEANELTVDTVLLIDPDKVDEDQQIAFEIIGALKRLLLKDPSNLNALSLLLTYSIDVSDDELWDYFREMALNDNEALFLADIIERLSEIEDLLPAYAILEETKLSSRGPQGFINLARLAIVDEDYALAKTQLTQCRDSVDCVNDELELELQRLELTAAQPEFEQRFAEIKVLLNDRRPITESDVELLEEAIELAPSMVDLYIVLYRCYANWQDNESAFEVLNDARQQIGEHPRITLSRAQLQWNSQQRDRAIETLNSGIEEFPNDVALLAQMASFLIENGQLSDAKQYVERAESIAPSHRALWQLKRLIAQKVSG